jgi:hypothetical protein
MNEQMYGVYPSRIVEVCDIHDKKLDDVIDESLSAVKFGLKMACEMIIKNRTYPISISLGDDMLIINADGTKTLSQQFVGERSAD